MTGAAFDQTGTEPGPADGNTAADGFTGSEKGFFADPEKIFFTDGDLFKNMGTVGGDFGRSVLVVDGNDLQSGLQGRKGNAGNVEFVAVHFQFILIMLTILFFIIFFLIRKHLRQHGEMFKNE